MSRRSAALTTTATALTALVVVGAATAASAGSDAPTPYRVTASGIELPAGDVFAEHRHVNVRYTSAMGQASRNVHVEGPGTAHADLLGASVLTWDRVGLPPDACVTWVQVAGYDEHFGEGGQVPVCRTTPTPTPAVTPTPTSTPTPTDVPTPTTPSPSTTPTTPPAPTPTAEVSQAPVPTPASGVPTRPTPAPSTSAPAPTPTERSEVLAEGAPTPGALPTVRAQVLGATEERSEVLAATGARAGVLLAGGIVALGLGTGLVVWRRGRATQH